MTLDARCKDSTNINSSLTGCLNETGGLSTRRPSLGVTFRLLLPDRGSGLMLSPLVGLAFLSRAADFLDPTAFFASMALFAAAAAPAFDSVGLLSPPMALFAAAAAKWDPEPEPLSPQKTPGLTGPPGSSLGIISISAARVIRALTMGDCASLLVMLLFWNPLLNAVLTKLSFLWRSDSGVSG